MSTGFSKSLFLKFFLDSPSSTDELSRKIYWEYDMVYSKLIYMSEYYSVNVYYDFGNNIDLKSDITYKDFKFFSARDYDIESYWNIGCKSWVEVKLKVTSKLEISHTFSVKSMDTIGETHLNAWKVLSEKCKTLKNNWRLRMKQKKKNQNKTS
jgi:hypothetical protein